MTFQIQTISFEEEGMTITYIELPADVRVEGNLAMIRHLRMNANHPDYREDAELLVAQATRALRSALEDFESSAPNEPGAGEDEDDEKGMGER
jgi:hypothetical protein